MRNLEIAGAVGPERGFDRLWDIAGIGDAGILGLFSRPVNGIVPND
jgi:hypothetical protein